jgi:hypothetical protein
MTTGVGCVFLLKKINYIIKEEVQEFVHLLLLHSKHVQEIGDEK